MYEETTYEVILQRMLARIPEGFDTREGSVIYDAIAPAAAELAQMYIELDNTRDFGFISTSSGEFLDRLVGEFGLTRLAPTKAVIKGTFNLNNIPIGSRFSCEKINYIVISKISNKNYRLECETAGTEGNISSGRLIPIDYIEGLTSANITELLILARNTETDSELKERYFTDIIGAARDGNVAQYEKWASEFEGIGQYNVTPCWDGVNTVEVTIRDEQGGQASEALIEAFQNFLDPEKTGLGNGAAPIGAVVTVDTVTPVNVSIRAGVTLNDGYTQETAKEMLYEDIMKYFRSIPLSKNVVRYFSIAAIVANCEAIASIGTTGNDRVMTGKAGTSYGTVDIQLDAREIPVTSLTRITLNLLST